MQRCLAPSQRDDCGRGAVLRACSGGEGGNPFWIAGKEKETVCDLWMVADVCNGFSTSFSVPDTSAVCVTLWKRSYKYLLLPCSRQMVTGKP